MVDPAWVALGLVAQVGAVRMRALVEAFGSPTAVLAADIADLQRVPGIGAVTAAAIRAVNLGKVELALARWGAAGVRCIAWGDSDYPRQLAQVDDAPPTLFARGTWNTADANTRSVAIVGTRNPTPQAAADASRIAYTLAQQGWIVVSGLARGIDSIAHREALAWGNHTLAVLGGGILPTSVYPYDNRDLAELIARSGGLLSEQHPQAESKATYLVARNRIITGIAHAVIVIETALDGGAMHAARRAQAQGRALYTLDLPATGNQALIEGGAGVVDVTRDELGIASP